MLLVCRKDNKNNELKLQRDSELHYKMALPSFECQHKQIRDVQFKGFVTSV